MEKHEKAYAKKIVLSEDNYNKLFIAMGKYNPERLEKQPKEPRDLYHYYTCIDGVYTWTKNSYENDLYVLCNEMRAILGHLTEYDEKSEKSKNNFEKAYGHFRRLSIDTLKILCNGLDQVFDEWIQEHAQYDFRNKDNEYLPEYVTLYYEAHNAYLEVQEIENLGSDRENGIIQKYHEVGRKYLEVYQYHIKTRRQRIEKTARRFKINNKLVICATVVFTILSIVGML